jgi:hypothetical protein
MKYNNGNNYSNPILCFLSNILYINIIYYQSYPIVNTGIIHRQCGGETEKQISDLHSCQVPGLRFETGQSDFKAYVMRKVPYHVYVHRDRWENVT